MKNILLYLLIISYSVFVIGCTDTTSNKNTIDSSQYVSMNSYSTKNNTSTNTDQVKSIFNTLTSNEMKGRLAGTPENEQSGGIILDYFKSLDLLPYDGINFFHEYNDTTYNIRTKDSEKSIVSIIIDGEKTNLLYGEDFLLGNSSSDLISEFKITNDSEIKNPSEYIYMSDDAEDLRKTKNRFSAYLLKSEIGYHPTNTSQDSFIIKLNPDVYEKLYTNIDNASVKINIKSNIVNENLKNIVGMISGQQKDKAIVISAHYDGVGYLNDKISYGAIDNASGLSTMLYIANDISQKYSNGLIPPYDIYFVAFNSEEIGLKGSQNFVLDISKKYDSMVNVNIDCLSGSHPLSFGSTSLSENKFIDDIKKEFSANNIVYDDIVYPTSDHISFINSGFPAITIGEFDEDIMPEIHTYKDSSDRVDLEYCKTVANTLSKYIIRKGGQLFNFTDIVPRNLENYDYTQIFLEAKKMLKKLNLKYNEYYCFIYDSLFVEITGYKAFTDLKEFDTYFSKSASKSIPTKLNNQPIYSISPSITPVSGSIKISTNNSSRLEKILTRDISNEPIKKLVIKYGDFDSGDDFLVLEILSSTLNDGSIEYNDSQKSETLMVDDVEYKLFNHPDIENSFYKCEVVINNNPVLISKQKPHIIDSELSLDSISTSISKTEMIEFIKSLPIDKIKTIVELIK